MVPPGPPSLLSNPGRGAQQSSPAQFTVSSFLDAGNVGPVGPVKLDPPNSDPSSVFIPPLTQMNLMQLQQQRMLLQQKQQQQSVPVRPGPTQAKPNNYQPGMCAQRLTHYMYQQQQRPEDNNIEFWRKFVAEYFAKNARKRWCVSQYGTGRQTTGVFPQDVWHCDICNQKPGRGFETTVEVLPRLLQIKYASGTLEELLYVDMPREYQNASGHIVLDYAKAIQESVFDQLRVVRDGQLRIVFSPDLKICSWEFCARRHEELIPRNLLIPQVSQLGAVIQKYQTPGPNASPSAQDMQTTCNSFVSSTRQLAKALEVPLVNDLGYTKRYVRCLQISEVVNSMKDLIDYSRETGTGPMDSLINFPRRNSSSAIRPQVPQDQNSNHNDANALRSTNVQLATVSNSIISTNSSVNAPSPVNGNLHQSSFNSGGPTFQIPSASSSNSIFPLQPNPSPSPLSSPANISAMQPTQNNSQNSVQQILQDMFMSTQLNNGSGITPILNGMNSFSNRNGIRGFGFGGIGPRAPVSGIRNVMNMNHISQDPTLMSYQQQQGIGRISNGLGSVNGFNNLQFDC